MAEQLIPIDQAGRIVLPKSVRQELDIKPGDLLKVSIQGAALTLTPNKATVGLVRKGKALVFSITGAETLDAESVQKILETAREEQGLRITSGLGARAKK